MLILNICGLIRQIVHMAFIMFETLYQFSCVLAFEFERFETVLSRMSLSIALSMTVERPFVR
jgi:hypothetical protein